MKSAAVLSLLPLAMAAPHIAKRAPVIVPRGARAIPGSYIVKMENKGIDAAVSSIAAEADHVFNKFGGFVATLTEAEVEKLRGNPQVKYIEQNAEMHAFATQEGAPWGLARLSNTEPGSTTYTYDESAGEGVCAYVLDTGIDIEHEEFEGRAEWLENFADDDDTDGYGHGTHVAGTIGSKTYGVAKKASLYAVKVLDSSGSGTNAGVIAGMEYVAEDATTRDCPNGAVANMSLGGGQSAAVNEAAAAIVDAGIFLGVAAGNSAADASTFSPASEESACTVGATEEDDTFASYSNYGSLVDILAPGSGVESTYPGGTTEILDGTSMATPHVVGLAAYFLGTGATTPEEACSYIASNALEGAISGAPNGTVNLLVQNGEA